MYHIIVADEENKKGIVKLVNSYPLSLPKADRLILAFPDGGELENIELRKNIWKNYKKYHQVIYLTIYDIFILY